MSLKALPFEHHQGQMPGSQTASTAVLTEPATGPHSTSPLRQGEEDTHHTEHAPARSLGRAPTYQVVVRPDPKQLPEIAEGHWSVGFEAEVIVMVSWGQVAPFTGQGRSTHKYCHLEHCLRKCPQGKHLRGAASNMLKGWKAPTRMRHTQANPAASLPWFTAAVMDT